MTLTSCIGGWSGRNIIWYARGHGFQSEIWYRIHGGITNFPTGLCCQWSQSITIHVKVAVDRANRKAYQLDRQAITIAPFNIIARSKAVILGQHLLYTVLALSTARVGILVLPCVVRSWSLPFDLLQSSSRCIFIHCNIRKFVVLLGTYYT